MQNFYLIEMSGPELERAYCTGRCILILTSSYLYLRTMIFTGAKKIVKNESVGGKMC